MERLNHIKALVFDGISPLGWSNDRMAACDYVAKKAVEMGVYRAAICSTITDEMASELLEVERRHAIYGSDEQFISAIRIVMLDEVVKILTARLNEEVHNLAEEHRNDNLMTSILPELEKVLPAPASIFESEELKRSLAELIQRNHEEHMAYLKAHE